MYFSVYYGDDLSHTAVAGHSVITETHCAFTLLAYSHYNSVAPCVCGFADERKIHSWIIPELSVTLQPLKKYMQGRCYEFNSSSFWHDALLTHTSSSTVRPIMTFFI